MATTKKASKTKKRIASPAAKKRQADETITLSLNIDEFEHIRDMLSVLLPNEESTTLSQALAQSEGRAVSEENLWEKIVDLCNSNGIEVGPNAPDFFVSIASPVSFGVFKVKEGE